MLVEEENYKYFSLFLLALPQTLSWTLTVCLVKNFILKPSGKTENFFPFLILLSLGVLGQDRPRLSHKEEMIVASLDILL